MRGSDFNWRDHASTSWAGSPEYEVLPDEPDVPVLQPEDARRIYEAATRARAGRSKRRWVIDHASPIFDRGSRFYQVLLILFGVALIAGTVWLAVWWFRPDAARANQRLVSALASYEAAQAAFDSQADCDRLASAYRKADAAFVSAAGTFVRLGDDASSEDRSAYAVLLERTDRMNRHFDGSGCPRP